MILYGSELVKQIRNEFDNAKSRIWIVVPFIGKWTEVKKIIGAKWIDNQKLDVRLITDIRNEEFINQETIQQFLYRAQVKTLDGLHAKIYIIDNTVFLTSANLSGTAFTRRYEICETFSINDSHDIISVFNDWWSISKKVPTTWTPSKKTKKGASDGDAGNTSGLKRLWKFPPEPILITDFKKYQDNIGLYNHFKYLYLKLVDRALPELPIFQEMDSFFNYLFHEHPEVPSYKYYKEKFRMISDRRRELDIIRYHKQFKKWINSDKATDSELYRLNNIKLVQTTLSLKNIDKLKRSQLYDITKCFHCMNSMAINRTKFLNPKNNNLSQIKVKWKNLLHNNSEEIVIRMQNAKMIGFGKSATQELVSLYLPNDYPVVNSNSNSGLKFFGYNIKTY